MTWTRNGGERRFWWRLAAATGLYLVIDGLADVAIGIGPLRFASAEWRYGAVGLVANRAGALAFALLLLGGAALRLNSWAWCRILAAAAALTAIVLAAAIPLFLLDTVQLWPGVSAGARRSMTLASVRAFALLLLFLGYCGWLALLLVRGSVRAGPVVPADMVMVGADAAGAGQP